MPRPVKTACDKPNTFSRPQRRLMASFWPNWTAPPAAHIVALSIREHTGVPVKFVGTGERPGDLEVFDPEPYVDALARPRRRLNRLIHSGQSRACVSNGLPPHAQDGKNKKNQPSIPREVVGGAEHGTIRVELLGIQGPAADENGQRQQDHLKSAHRTQRMSNIDREVFMVSTIVMHVDPSARTVIHVRRVRGSTVVKNHSTVVTSSGSSRQ